MEHDEQDPNPRFNLRVESLMVAPSEARYRLERAESHLAYLQGFFPRIDTKVSALFGICTAELAVALLNINPIDLQRWYVSVPLGIFIALLIWTYVHLYRCTFPHLEGGTSSLVYFQEISKRTELTFVADYCGADTDAMLKDYCGQIWRNSPILTLKYQFLTRSTLGALLSVVPWGVVLLATSLTNARVPLLG
jgi:hypothetical protein